MRLNNKSFARPLACLVGLVGCLQASGAVAADYGKATVDVLDPNPVYAQMPAVDGLNVKMSVVSGAIGGYANHMFTASAAIPFPYLNQFGAQVDLAIGNYRSDYTSAGAGLHLFWRDPSIGMFGIYADWGYVNPEHAGRLGAEGAIYNGRWTLEGFAGVQFGQHVLPEFVDEVDLSYYFTDNFRGSVGHRLISRGHVGNISFEYMPASFSGWSIFGEAEAGEDDYHSAWIGLRYAFGSGGEKTLIERDRSSSVQVRIPRNIASVTQCGDIPDPADYHKSWNGFEVSYEPNLCASEDELDSLNAPISKK